MQLQVRTIDRLARERLIQEAGLSPLLARLLAARGVRGPADARLELAGLLPPDTMRGLPEAVRLLDDAVTRQQKILIVGDYDCDGATAIAVAVLGLRSFGAQVDYLVPNRFDNGYGLTPEVVDLALVHPRLGRPDLLVTVDNGIAAHAGIARAHEVGLPVLVTDHHLPGETLPQAAAIIDPNQPGCGFPSKALAGVGVMFYLLVALRARCRQLRPGSPGADAPIANLLDLVALGTVADVVPLDRNNRILVAAGLARIRSGRCRPGITALLQVARRSARQVAAADLGFAVGPRLNAAGRLADMSLGVECLLADDSTQALERAEALDGINRERRSIEETMRDQALDSLQHVSPERRGLVVHDEHWHHGVIGLVASRVKDKHHRPCIALAPDDQGNLRGSGRSILGAHLRDILDLVDKRHPGMLLKFGGHAMAAGLTLQAGDRARFETAFDEAVGQLADPEAFSPTLITDGPLSPEEMSLQTVAEIDAQVWGQGFAPPLFSGRFTVLSQRLIKDRHLKLELADPSLPRQRLPAIYFGRVDRLPEQAVLAYRLSRDDYQGNARISLMIDRLIEDDAGAAR